ncbi:MAG: SH3 domain-containing protein [Lachnospiraceae bacterium]|nr:SH3 domain-containing protein [Lachnospiraceae bacterium]
MKHLRLIPAFLTASLFFSFTALAEVRTMPGVTEEMLDYDYWLSGQEETEEVLNSIKEIEKLNKAFLDTPECNMNDLKNEKKTFDGVSFNRARWKAAMTELAGFLDGGHYDSEGGTVSGQYAMKILTNVEDPEAAEEQDLKYGIAVHRTDLRAYPTELGIMDDPGDNDFDNVQLSGIRVGEPLTIYARSEDSKYFYCHTTNAQGWVPSCDVAICRNKKEWIKATDIPAQKAVVVTDGKAYLEKSNNNPELSGLLLTMGTVLQGVDEADYDEPQINRASYYNYPVWVPVRNDEGMYERKQALISKNQKVSSGYLPLTYKNILEVAYNMLGDAYGWGGMLDSEDCSGYVRDIYKCFGLELPRNTTWQAAIPAQKYDLSTLSREEKEALLHFLPPGTILFFKGHEMLYLGHSASGRGSGDGTGAAAGTGTESSSGNTEHDYYVISATSSMMDPERDGKLRARSILINTLDVKRANGNLWIDDIYEAVLPYEGNPSNEFTSISINGISENAFSEGEEVSGGVSENKALTDGVAENAVSEGEGASGGVSENKASTDGVSGDSDSAFTAVAFDDSLENADKSRIKSGEAHLYRTTNEKRKNRTVCLNAGHGTVGGDRVKTLCHPDGSPKIVGGSTKKGDTESVAVSAGTTMLDGTSEADANLKVALAAKEALLEEGYDVLMIRDGDDVQLDNIARTLIANNNADIHIALHYDSSDTDKGAFYCSVPEDEVYRNMEPVKTHWREHERLGQSLVDGLRSTGNKIKGSGAMSMDLTQTSYSTIPSVDLEVGDKASDRSDAAVEKIVEGMIRGINRFFRL